jgi:hypothetical protein
MTAAINLSCVPTPVSAGIGAAVDLVGLEALRGEGGEFLFDESGTVRMVEEQ